MMVIFSIVLIIGITLFYYSKSKKMINFESPTTNTTNSYATMNFHQPIFWGRGFANADLMFNVEKYTDGEFDLRAKVWNEDSSMSQEFSVDSLIEMHGYTAFKYIQTRWNETKEVKIFGNGFSLCDNIALHTLGYQDNFVLPRVDTLRNWREQIIQRNNHSWGYIHHGFQFLTDPVYWSLIILISLICLFLIFLKTKMGLQLINF